MAGQTRVNGSGLSTAGNVFSNGHVFAFKILVKIANGTAVGPNNIDTSGTVVTAAATLVAT